MCIAVELGNLTKKNVQNLGTFPKLSDPPLTPLWEQKSLGTFYFLKTPSPPLMNLGTLILVSLIVLNLKATKLGG